jgi:hypothetical protein
MTSFFGFKTRFLSLALMASSCAGAPDLEPLETTSSALGSAGAYDHCRWVLEGDLFNKVTSSNSSSHEARKMVWSIWLTMSESQAYDSYSAAYDQKRREAGGGGFSFLGIGASGGGSVENKLSRSEFSEHYSAAKSMNSGNSGSQSSESSHQMGQYATYIRDPNTINAWKDCVTKDAAVGLYVFGHRDAQNRVYVSVVWTPGTFAASVPTIRVSFVPVAGMTINAPANLEVGTGTGVTFAVDNADPDNGFSVAVNGETRINGVVQSFTTVAAVPAKALKVKIPMPNLVQNPGFESSPVRQPLPAPWFGSNASGVDLGLNLALEGRNNGFIWVDGKVVKWEALNQWVNVNPNTEYLAKAWIRTSDYFGAGAFEVRAEEARGFGVLGGAPFAALPGGYQEQTFTFNSGPNSRVLIYSGFHSAGPMRMPRPGPLGSMTLRWLEVPTAQWMQLDQVSLTELSR